MMKFLDAPQQIDYPAPPVSSDGMVCCPLCGGKGWHYTCLSCRHDGSYSLSQPGYCYGCNGSGKVADCRNAVWRI